MQDSDAPLATPLNYPEIFARRPWNDPEWRSPEGKTWAELAEAAIASVREREADEAFLAGMRADLKRFSE